MPGLFYQQCSRSDTKVSRRPCLKLLFSAAADRDSFDFKHGSSTVGQQRKQMMSIVTAILRLVTDAVRERRVIS